MTQSVPRMPMLSGALVSIPDSGAFNVIAFSINPSTLKRTLEPQTVGGDEGNRSQAVRFMGAPVQTITADVEMDANMSDPSEGMGISRELAALELLVYPASTDITSRDLLLSSGVIEIAPMVAPRTLFIWGKSRVLPVRLTSYSITEEAFDPYLYPIRATVSLTMRVLNYSDMNSDTKDYHQFLVYQQTLEAAAQNVRYGNIDIGVNPGTL